MDVDLDAVQLISPQKHKAEQLAPNTFHPTIFFFQHFVPLLLIRVELTKREPLRRKSNLLSMTKLRRKLRLHPRTKTRDGGMFAYHDAESNLYLTFRWDGAGVTDSGKIVLFEQEGPGFQALHVQGHLTRLLFMLRAGEAIEKLIWVVPKARYRDLDKVVYPWVRMWGASFGATFPLMEYRDENGSYLGPIGASQTVKHRAKPVSSKNLNFGITP